MAIKLETNLDLVEDGERITIYPRANNPLHKKPTLATYSGGYVYCDGTKPEDGPDYYFRDFNTYNEGFTAP